MEIDKLKEIAQKVETSRSQIQNEQATKTAFIMPFLQAWGYDVFNPMEVHPEYSADLTGLKGEKVDYAICLDNQPIILMECKSCHQNLEHPKHSSQLHRYFIATRANFGVLTNGIIYRFYTDIDRDNIMDDKPFFEFNILDFDESSVNELKRFSKSTNFDPDAIKEAARIKKVIAQQLNDPSPEFVKFFVSHVHSGVRTASVVDKFTEIIKRSLKEYINDIIKEKFEEVFRKEPESNPADTPPAEDTPPEEPEEPGINPEKLEGFYVIKSILREEINTARIQYKDTRSYFGINLDGKVTKTVCRLRFHEKTGKKSISIPDNVETGKEATTNIDSLDEIYGVAEFLKSRIRYLTQDTYKSKSEKTESI
ncbi:type I restriction endonuclease [Microcystis aeruginosa]|uniref:type I restriction endonuclease n=1 Tax=Microcystis aeruginosa TaxID=1126 RepID=UPI002331100C|nr:type I restriction endonuclease [Microcystis aeruginosa]MDB9412301.1 type I restriction endonuclease [Microcystis aeruginosa CS-567/02]